MNIQTIDEFTNDVAGRLIKWRHGGGDWLGELPYDLLRSAVIAGSPAMPGILEESQFKVYGDAFSYRDPTTTHVFEQWHAQTTSLAELWRREHGGDVIAELPGTWCYLAQPWSNVFWHWMCEGLIKIAALESAGFKGGYIIPSGERFISRSLELLDISPSRIYVCEAPYARIENLLIPRRFRGQLDLRNRLDAVDWLRERLIREQHADPDLRIYVARRARRAISNEDDLLSLLSRHSFQSVFMEDLDLDAQIALISKARIFAGPHGSGFAHTMFMPHRSHIIEIFSPSCVNPCMLATIKHLEQDYSMIVGYTSLHQDLSTESAILANIELVSLALERAKKLDLTDKARVKPYPV